MEAIILTAAIDISQSNPYKTALSDVQERLDQYFGSLIFYITRSNFGSIIFCENTDYHFDNKPYIDLAKLYHKKIEFLTFKGDVDEIKKKGKGYGDGECVDYAVRNSKLLLEEKSFYKVTGRLKIININHIIKSAELKETCFLTFSPEKKMIDTRFFKCEKRLYFDLLVNVHMKVNDYSGYYLEHVFFDELRDFDFDSFLIYPEFQGKSGSLNSRYQKQFINMLFCPFGFFSLKKHLKNSSKQNPMLIIKIELFFFKALHKLNDFKDNLLKLIKINSGLSYH